MDMQRAALPGWFPDTWMPYSGHIQETLLATPAMIDTLTESIHAECFLKFGDFTRRGKIQMKHVEGDGFVRIFHRPVFSLWCHH